MAIPDSVTTIGYVAFENCHNLTSITIGNGVTSIGNSAFSSCCRLVEVCNNSELPITAGSGSYGYIGKYAKNIYSSNSGSSKLRTDANGFIIYDNDTVVNYIGSATEITIPNGITSINRYAFYYCDKLTSVTIPDGVTTIGSYAFSGCYRLVEVCNNSKLNVTKGSDNFGYIGKYAKNVYSSNSGSSKLKTDTNGFVIYDNDTVVSYIGSATQITIPSGITDINTGAFYDCSELTSITIGNGVTSIGSGVFWNCSRLTSITYNGTKAQWKAIEKDSYWNDYTGNFTITCTDGKLDKNGNEI